MLWLVEAGREWARDLTASFSWTGTAARRLINYFGRRLPAIFWKDLAPHMLSHPVKTYTRLESIDDGRANFLDETAAGKIVGMVLRTTTDYAQIVSLDGKSTGLGFEIRGETVRSYWAAIDFRPLDFTTAHLEWRVCEAVSGFARNPTQSTLQSQLAVIQGVDPMGISVALADFMPWQIALPLLGRESGLTWNEIIERVGAGCMGAESDWERWEQQVKAGIQLRDLRVIDELSVTDDHKGLIVGRGSWTFRRNESLNDDFVAEIIDALNQWPDITRQESLINFCCYLLRPRGLGRQLPSSVLSKTSAMLLRKLVDTTDKIDVRLARSILPVIIFNEAPVEERQDLLARVGRQALRPWHFDAAEDLDEKLGLELAQLIASSEQMQILRALSFLPPLLAIRRLAGAPLENLGSSEEFVGSLGFG